MINKILPRKLNSASDSRVSDSSDMRDAVNVSSSEDFRDSGEGATGNSGVLKPIKSNLELGNTVFDGTTELRIIGKVICDKHNVIYFFVCDKIDSSRSGVYAYDPDKYLNPSNDDVSPSDIIKVYTSSSFEFNELDFVKGDITYVQKKFESDGDKYETTPYLFFTNNRSEPKKLNVLRAYRGTDVAGYAMGSDAEIDFITACPVTPSMPATASFRGSSQSGNTNEFINVNGFQFAYQLIYKDGNESAISTYSDIAIPIDYINQGTDASVDTTAFDVCDVTIPSDHINSEVATVRIIARRGNDGAWQSIHEEDDPDVSGFTYSFFNNTVDTAVPTEDIAKQFTNLPKKAYTQTIIGDRVFYGNYVEGFDNFPVDSDITAVAKERPIDGIDYEIEIENSTCLSELDEFLRHCRDRSERPELYQEELESEGVDVDALLGQTFDTSKLDLIFDYDNSVNINPAFTFKADDLPNEIPVGRSVNISITYAPKSNFHTYQARNEAGYHASAQLGDYFGDVDNAPQGAAEANDLLQKTAHYMSFGQVLGSEDRYTDKQPFVKASFSETNSGILTFGSIHLHPQNAFGLNAGTENMDANFPKHIRDFTLPLLNERWARPDAIVGARDTGTLDSGKSIIGTSAYTPLVIPMDNGESLTISMTVNILDLSDSGFFEVPTFVTKKQLLEVIANFLTRGNATAGKSNVPIEGFAGANTGGSSGGAGEIGLEGDGGGAGLGPFVEDIFELAPNDSFDEEGWFQTVEIDRGLTNGEEFSPFGSFAKTVTPVGLGSECVLSSAFTDHIETSDPNGVFASSAVTVNKASVKFRLFYDHSYKRPARSANPNSQASWETWPVTDIQYNSLSGEGIDNDNQRVGLYTEYINDIEFMTCVRLPGFGTKWKIHSSPSWDFPQSLDVGDITGNAGTNPGPYIPNPETIISSAAVPGLNGPLSHLIGKLVPSFNVTDGYEEAQSFNINGLYPTVNAGTEDQDGDMDFTIFYGQDTLETYQITNMAGLAPPGHEFYSPDSPLFKSLYAADHPRNRRRKSQFSLVDGGTFGAGAVGSISDSQNAYDTCAIIARYVESQYSSPQNIILENNIDNYVIGGYTLGTMPMSLSKRAGVAPVPFEGDGSLDLVDQTNHRVVSGMLSNATDSSSANSMWYTDIGSDEIQPQGWAPGTPFIENKEVAIAAMYPGSYVAYYPRIVISDTGDEGYWHSLSESGQFPTAYWFGREHATPDIQESSGNIEFEGVDGTRSFKTSAYHGFGIVYYDKRGRACSLKSLGEMYSPPYHSRINAGAISCNIKLNHAAPDWAEYFQIVYTGNTSYSDFIQYSSGGAFAVSTDDDSFENGNIFVSLNYLQGNIYVSYAGAFGARDVDGSEILYTPQPGDILRVISYYDENDERVFAGPQYSFEVVDYRKLNNSADNPFFDSTDGGNSGDSVSGAQAGDFVVIRNNPQAYGFRYTDVLEGNNNSDTTAHFWNDKTIIEICRPTDAQAEENQFFYESSVVFPISEHNQTIEFNKGDVWFRRVPTNLAKKENQVYKNLIRDDGKGDPNFINYYLESKTFNDKVRKSDVWSKGKIKIENPDEHEVRREASITFSDKNNPASKFLRLTSFSPSQLQFKDMPLEHGAINYLANQQDSILSIQKNKTASVPFNRNIISTAAGQDSIVASTNVLGTEIYYAGKYGCDDNPESVCEIDGVIYFASKSNAEVYRFSPGSGVQVISDVGMKSFFRRLFKAAEEQVAELGPVRVVGGYDPLKKEFLLSVYNFNDEEGGSSDFDANGDVEVITENIYVLPESVTIPAEKILERIPQTTRFDTNADGLVQINDMLDFLSVFGFTALTPEELGPQTFTEDDDDAVFNYPEL